MAVQYAVLFNPTLLTGSAAVIFTMGASPASLVLVNGRVRLANNSGSPIAVTLYAVPSAGSPGVGNCIYPGVSLAANAIVDVDIPEIGPGWTLQGFAGTASEITISPISGFLWS